jgi:hypothetical protein
MLPGSPTGSTLQLGGPPNTEAVTDDTGRFVFNGVVPGQYRLSVDRDRYLHQEFGQRSLTSTVGTIITVAPGQQVTNIDFQMTPTGSISGRILDEDGEPLADVLTQAQMYGYQQGRRVLMPAGRTTQTNDLGEFRIFGLNPGEYYVAAVSRGTPLPPVNPIVNQRAVPQRGAGGNLSSAVAALAQQFDKAAYPVIYYPGTPYYESATLVPAAPGAEVRGIEFAVHPVATVSVTGQVVVPPPSENPNTTVSSGSAAPPGNAARPAGTAPVNVTLMRVTSSGPTMLTVVTMVTQYRASVRPDGSFELTNVIPGSYNVVGSTQQNGQEYSARVRIEVGDRGIENLSIALRPSVSIPGRIFISATPPPSFKMNQLRVMLQEEDMIPGSGIARPAPGQVADDGTFLLTNVSLQTYRVRVVGGGAPTYLMSGRIGNEDAVNHPFAITADQDLNLQLQLGFANGRVAGTVVDDKGNPYPGALATLIPDEPARPRAELYLATPTDQYGHFSFPNIPTGGYKLFAWEDLSGTAYQDPEFIRRYESRGIALKVDSGSSIQQQVTVTHPQ